MVYIEQYNIYIELNEHFDAQYYIFDKQSSCFNLINRENIAGFSDEIIFLMFVSFSSDKKPEKAKVFSTLAYQPYKMIDSNRMDYYHIIIDDKNHVHSTMSNEITMKLFKGEDIDNKDFWREWNVNERFKTFGDIVLYKGYHYYSDVSSSEYYTCDSYSLLKYRIYAHYFDKNGHFCHYKYLYNNDFYMAVCSPNSILVIYPHEKLPSQFNGKFLFLKKVSTDKCAILLLDSEKYYWVIIDKLGNCKTYNTHISSSYKLQKGESYYAPYYLFIDDRKYLLWNNQYSKIELEGVFEDNLHIEKLSIKEREGEIYFYVPLAEKHRNGYYIINKYGHKIYEYINEEQGYIVIMYPQKQFEPTKKLYGYANSYGEFVLYPVFDSIKAPLFCKEYLFTEQRTSKKSCIYSVYDRAGNVLYQDSHNLPLHVSKSANSQIEEYIFQGQLVNCLDTYGTPTGLNNNYIIVTLYGGSKIVMYGENRIFQDLEDAMPIPCVSFPTFVNSIAYMNPDKMLLFKKDGKWGVSDNEGNILLPNIYENICYAFYKLIADGHVFKYNKHLKTWEDITPTNAALVAIGDFHFAYRINNEYFIQNSSNSGLINSSEFFVKDEDDNKYYSLSFNNVEEKFESYRNYIHDNYDDDDSCNYYNDNIDMDQQSTEFWNNI